MLLFLSGSLDNHVALRSIVHEPHELASSLGGCQFPKTIALTVEGIPLER